MSGHAQQNGTSIHRAIAAFVVVLVAFGSPLASQLAERPSPGTGAVRFAVIGDNGTGKQPQFDVAYQMMAVRLAFPFEFVIMLGDNMYGSQDFVKKFERPYAALLQAGIPFYAALGNHDSPDNRSYRGFNMNGDRYYSFAKKNVRFFVFDTNLMDRTQVAWIDDTLGQAQEEWKIAYFHHPLYSDGVRHGSNLELRVMLEPLLVKHGVDVVFSGHEHFYQRTTPQKGITYFIEGASGQLRKGGVKPTAMSAAAYAEDQTFMLVEVVGPRLSFRTISRAGRNIDSGEIHLEPES